jgi:hypothetical protein
MNLFCYVLTQLHSYVLFTLSSAVCICDRGEVLQVAYL